MSEPVVYSEVKFKRGLKGNTVETGPPLKAEEDLVYSDVVIARTGGISKQDPIVVPDDSSPTERSKGKGTSAHRHRRLVVVVLCILILTLGLAIGLSLYLPNTSKPKEETQKPTTQHTTNSPKDSTTERKKETSVTDSSAGCRFGTCKNGWKFHKQRCYFFSTRNQTWAESKEECVSRSSDLAVINNEDEQVFLMSKISKIMRHAEDKFWIGLNDIDEEGQWKWVDNTPYNEPKFWLDGQPDDRKGKDDDLHPTGEDCVRMGEKGFNLRKPQGWIDTGCHKMMKFICETATCL